MRVVRVRVSGRRVGNVRVVVPGGRGVLVEMVAELKEVVVRVEKVVGLREVVDFNVCAEDLDVRDEVAGRVVRDKKLVGVKVVVSCLVLEVGVVEVEVICDDFREELGTVDSREVIVETVVFDSDCDLFVSIEIDFIVVTVVVERALVPEVRVTVNERVTVLVDCDDDVLIEVKLVERGSVLEDILSVLVEVGIEVCIEVELLLVRMEVAVTLAVTVLISVEVFHFVISLVNILIDEMVRV